MYVHLLSTQKLDPSQHCFATLLVSWFGHAARRAEGELIKNLPLQILTRTWRKRTRGQLKTWATTIKADVELLFGPRAFVQARWRNDWVKVSSELAHDRRAWSASVREAVNAIGDAGSTRPGWMPKQISSSKSIQKALRKRYYPLQEQKIKSIFMVNIGMITQLYCYILYET